MRVVAAEASDGVQVRGVGIVLIEQLMPAVVQREQRFPIGPSVGPASAWISTRSPSSSTGSPLRVATNRRNPRSANASRSSSVG